MRRYTSMLFAVVIAAAFLAAESNMQTGTTVKPTVVERVVILSVTGGRVRTAPNTQSEIIKEFAIGTRFVAVSEKNGWNEIKLEPAAEGGTQSTGWISKTITEPYNAAQPGVQYQRIIEKYLSRKELGFQTAVELFESISPFADDAKTYEIGGDLRLKRLIALSRALLAVPFDKAEVSPYKEFLTKYKDDVVYSEPAGEWYVRAERFWELHDRYKKHKVGESIAWRAAGNPSPGECEGYINCYLYRLREREGEYLNFYPGGQHSKQALEHIRSMLDPIVADIQGKQSYYTTNDISDRAEFNRMLSEIRKIVSRTAHVEKQEVLKQIAQIAEGYR